jgi:hypothetical protein
MPGKRGISASQLARDYGVSLNKFADEIIATLARLDGEGAPARSDVHRREICAAVSAAMALAMDDSTLTPEERAQLQPLLHQVLLPFWTKHCTADAASASMITQRSEHYMANRVAGSQVKSAVRMVAALLEALDVPPGKRDAFSRTLAPAFAHRMVGDVYHLNDMRSRFGIELPVLAMMAAMLQMSMSYDPILKILRIS